MIKRTEQSVITFPTTTQAMAMESCCEKEGIPGRLIPLPSKISAGCGLAWKTKMECRESVLDVMERYHISWEAIYTLELR